MYPILKILGKFLLRHFCTNQVANGVILYTTHGPRAQYLLQHRLMWKVFEIFAKNQNVIYLSTRIMYNDHTETQAFKQKSNYCSSKIMSRQLFFGRPIFISVQHFLIFVDYICPKKGRFITPPHFPNTKVVSKFHFNYVFISSWVFHTFWHLATENRSSRKKIKAILVKKSWPENVFALPYQLTQYTKRILRS